MTYRYILPTLVCQRCGHSWTPRKPDKPVICPKCKSPYWDRPRANGRKENK